MSIAICGILAAKVNCHFGIVGCLCKTVNSINNNKKIIKNNNNNKIIIII